MQPKRNNFSLCKFGNFWTRERVFLTLKMEQLDAPRYCSETRVAKKCTLRTLNREVRLSIWWCFVHNIGKGFLFVFEAVAETVLRLRCVLRWQCALRRNAKLFTARMDATHATESQRRLELRHFTCGLLAGRGNAIGP